MLGRSQEGEQSELGSDLIDRGPHGSSGYQFHTGHQGEAKANSASPAGKVDSMAINKPIRRG